MGCTAETLRKWAQQAERDTVKRAGTTSAEQEGSKEFERESHELKRADEILRGGWRMSLRRISAADPADG